MKRLTALAAPLLLVACATPTLNTPIATPEAVAREAALQRRFVIERQRDHSVLVSRVAYRLSTAAVEFCGEEVSGSLGLAAMTAKDFSGEFEDVARSDFGFFDGQTVVGIVDGGPAHLAGVEPGDRILSIAGVPLPTSRRDADRVQRSLKESADAQSSIPVVISRNGEERRMSLRPTAACNYPVRVENSDAINALTDGENIAVFTGLLNFVRSEEELALVLSHEISHNVLDHIEKQRRNRALGTIAGAAVDIIIAATTGVITDLSRTGGDAGALAYSVEFEQEADYQALYIMRRAGYEIDEAVNLWRRMAAENPDRIVLRTTHPATAERFVALANAVDEIGAKEVQGLALLPNSQAGRSTTAIAAARNSSTQPTALTAAPQRSVASLSPSPSRATPARPQSAALEKPNLRVRGGTVTRFDSGPSTYLPDPYGAWIDDVEPGGPAANAGIRRTDIIRTFNGHRVETFEELESYASETVPGSKVRLGVFRNRELITIEVDL